MIRSMILPSEVQQSENDCSLEAYIIALPKHRFPPCYLVLSDGIGTAVVQRDLEEADVKIDKEFIVVTNNDISTKPLPNPKSTTGMMTSLGLEIDECIQESEERKACVARKWDGV